MLTAIVDDARRLLESKLSYLSKYDNNDIIAVPLIDIYGNDYLKRTDNVNNNNNTIFTIDELFYNKQNMVFEDILMGLRLNILYNDADINYICNILNNIKINNSIMILNYNKDSNYFDNISNEIILSQINNDIIFICETELNYYIIKTSANRIHEYSIGRLDKKLYNNYNLYNTIINYINNKYNCDIKVLPNIMKFTY